MRQAERDVERGAASAAMLADLRGASSGPTTGESGGLLDVALANMPHGLCMFDDRKHLILCNAAYARLYDLPGDLTIAGTPLDRILEFRRGRGNAPTEMNTYFQVVEDANRSKAHAARRIRLQDGRTIQITHNPMGRGGYVATHEDVTVHLETEATALRLATHDVLTGLPNRALFSERLALALGGVRPDRTVAIHCLDLDRFKTVNDTYGHGLGDLLLQAVKDRLLACIASGEIVARLSGDEFVVLQVGLARPGEAREMPARLAAEMARPFVIEGHELTIGVSIGTALCLEEGLSADALLRNADIALHRAKLDGRNTCRVFEPDMGTRMRDRRRLEADMRDALAVRGFEVHYQPLVDAVTAEIGAFEALLRWDHPRRGRVSPVDFIPIAEDSGFIMPLGAWVLGQACKDAVNWPGHVRVAVNLSPLQFNDGEIVRTVRAALAASGLPASRLELEITESVLLVDGEATLSLLHELRHMGVRIALDDFGTGYSSLSYLRRFPFDKIKIDRSFIRDMADSEDCAAIVKAVATLGRALRMTVTAEGVETPRQLAQVRAQGCDEIQGYLYGAAGPVGTARDLLRSGCLRPEVSAPAT